MKFIGVLPSGPLLAAVLSLAGCMGTAFDGQASGGSTSGTGGSGTTGGSIGGCPVGWVPCAPANICDNGCSPDGGACVDQLSANPAQTGTICGAGACEGSQCLPAGPQVPYQDGGVIANPNIVIITFDDDPNQFALERWGVWIADGGYLPSTIGEYGVGNGTVEFARLHGTEPGQSDIDGYLNFQLMTNPLFPPNAANNIYVLFLPATWSDITSFCKKQYGYHTYDGSMIYAVVPNCSGALQSDVEVSAAHEIVEAATDPYSSSWIFTSSSPWWYLGGELGDMCEGMSTYDQASDGGYAGQYIWSNAAAASGRVPCQPWPAGDPYIGLTAPPALIPAAPGTLVSIPVTGWANQPVKSWAVLAEDAPFNADFLTYPTLASSTIEPGQQVMAQLNIPAATPGQPPLAGQVGGAWVYAAVGNGDYNGSTMVGVIVGCETNADCSNALEGCSFDGGIGDSGLGFCGTNFCEPTAQPFSTCSADGPSDGVCLPIGYDVGTLEVCSQAGTMPAGKAGCKQGRIVGAMAADYCDPSSLCEGTDAPACFQLCTGDGISQGTCPSGQLCYPGGGSYGYCVDACTSDCPPNQTCEGFFCMPN